MEQNNNSNTKKPNLYCEICQFQAIRPAEFIRHVNSNKHKRNGVKIKDTIYRCDKCDKILANHFSYKIHQIQIHGTLEEKLKQRYYCEICDKVFISKLYMDNHINGIRHANVLKSVKLLENIKIEQIAKKLNVKLNLLDFDLDEYISEINSYIADNKNPISMSI